MLVPLHGTDPGTPDSSDLETLARWLSEASLIGLGERQHGTHDYPLLGHRVFAHLARAHGYSVFALEISQAHAARLDEYVQGRRDDLDLLMAERWWVAERWYSRALRDQLVWMRRHSRDAGQPVHVAGFDFKHPSFAMTDLVERLRALDERAARRVEALYASIPRRGFGVYPNVYGYHGLVKIPLPPGASAATVEIGGRIRGRGVGYGLVGLGAQLGDESSLAGSYLKPDQTSESGTSVEVELAIPDDADDLYLVVMHRGNGTVWFDELYVEVDDTRIGLEIGPDDVEMRPLLFPHLQAMDYSHRSEDGALRVECDPVVDEILAAVRAADEAVNVVVLESRERLSSREAAWLRQLSRLVVQSAEWRTLYENNRDVFMAENVRWLSREGFPDARMVLFGHTSHIERLPRHRMGGLLAEHFGRRYAPVTLLTASGSYSDVGDLRTFQPGDELETVELDLDERSLARRLHAIGKTSSILNVAGATASDAARAWLSAADPSIVDRADAVILLESVRPHLPP